MEKRPFLFTFQQNRPCQGQDEWFDEIILIYARDINEATIFIKSRFYDIRNVFSKTYCA